MLFAVFALDKPGVEALRVQHRQAHIDHFVALGPGFRLGGALLDEAGRALGGMLAVIEAEDMEAAQRFVRADPFVEEGLFAEIHVRPFRPGHGVWLQDELARAKP
jgi:uncharacterized protein YciI